MLGLFLDRESDSKCEREPRGCKYKKKNPANRHDVLGEYYIMKKNSLSAVRI